MGDQAPFYRAHGALVLRRLRGKTALYERLARVPYGGFADAIPRHALALLQDERIRRSPFLYPLSEIPST